jgi:hypothetical protein
MDIRYIIIPLVFCIVPILWILYQRKEEEAIRSRLGDGAVRVDLFHRPLRYTRSALIVLFIVVMAVGVILYALRNVDGWATLTGIFRMFWMIPMSQAVERTSRLIVGPKGIALPGAGEIEWKNIIAVNWDRDIGQQQWGATIERIAGRQHLKQRLYLRRDIKPEAEALIAKFSGQTGEVVPSRSRELVRA